MAEVFKCCDEHGKWFEARVVDGGIKSRNDCGATGVIYVSTTRPISVDCEYRLIHDLFDIDSDEECGYVQNPLTYMTEVNRRRTKFKVFVWSYIGYGQ